MKITFRNKLLFSSLTGMLLWLGWPEHGFPILLLFAFCPLFIIEEFYYRHNKDAPYFGFFNYAFLSMLLFNGLTTWWVCNSTIIGGVLAIIFNSLFMSIVLFLFHKIRVKTTSVTGYASLLFIWLTFEYIHLNWQLSWPWLTLGNGFANYPSLVQWYEFTGILGGSLWILLSNILLFQLINHYLLFKSDGAEEYSFTPKLTAWAETILIIIPIVMSIMIGIYYSIDFCITRNNIVIVQPNIDPYNEKFSGDFKTQLDRMLVLADQKVDNNTEYLVLPETGITEEMWENNLNSSYSIPFLRNYLIRHPRMSIVTGAETFKVYKEGEEIPASARKFTDNNGYYDAFNTALQIDTSKNVQVYHKSKLVPGVEFMPFQKLLAPLGKIAFDLGGTSGTLGTQKEPTVFYSPGNKMCVAPMICYESIYGEYLGEYIKKGAGIIFIITNDGWWKDSPGYRQHLCYARLRAIESRRTIVRCANTGISAFINDKGDILQQTSWWQPAVLKAKVCTCNYKTFYTLHGDFIGRDSCIMTLLLLLFIILTTLFQKKEIIK